MEYIGYIFAIKRKKVKFILKEAMKVPAALARAVTPYTFSRRLRGPYGRSGPRKLLPLKYFFCSCFLFFLSFRLFYPLCTFVSSVVTSLSPLTHKYPCFRRDSNPYFQQAIGRKRFDPPARSDSFYRLNYPGPHAFTVNFTVNL
jgi:hypothetical protein